MPIPDYQTLMLPLLRLASDGQEHRFRDAVEQLAAESNISDAERAELLPSGSGPVFDNRVGWARTYLKQAGLLNPPKRGTLQITDRGRNLLSNNPRRIDVKLLNQYEEFREFRTRKGNKTAEGPALLELDREPEQTPEEALAAAYGKLRGNLEAEVLAQVKAASPSFFERVVIDHLVAMGYGGSRQDAGREGLRGAAASGRGGIFHRPCSGAPL